jgi:hypothetical protein
VKQLKKAFGSSVFTREHVADVLKVAVPTVTRSVAACAHFGLLSKAEGGYTVTQLGKIVCDPLDGEIEHALNESFRTPTLYQELLERYEPEGRIPERLSTILHRAFGIAENAADLAASVFVKSGRFAGILSDDLSIVSAVEPTVTAESLPPESQSSLPVDGNRSQAASQRLQPQSQEFHFKLSKDKFATLIVPPELEARDIALLRKQIELLELQIEGE